MGVLRRKVDFNKIKKKIWLMRSCAYGDLRRCVITIIQYQHNVQMSAPDGKPTLISEGANKGGKSLLFVPRGDSDDGIQSQKTL